VRKIFEITVSFDRNIPSIFNNPDTNELSNSHSLHQAGLQTKLQGVNHTFVETIFQNNSGVEGCEHNLAVIANADEDIPRATDCGNLEYSIDSAVPMDIDCPQDCSSAEDVCSLTEGQTSSTWRPPSSSLSAGIKKAQELKQSTDENGPKFSCFTWDPLAMKTNVNAEAAFERVSQLLICVVEGCGWLWSARGRGTAEAAKDHIQAQHLHMQKEIDAGMDRLMKHWTRTGMVLRPTNPKK
jgi:hypothetical protein